jgi:diketogulonate reductase-like aldo/keto reductase
VLIRWTLQRGYVCIPKSVKADRIQQNADVFDWALSDDDMAALNGFDEGLVTGWNPVIQP